MFNQWGNVSYDKSCYKAQPKDIYSSICGEKEYGHYSRYKCRMIVSYRTPAEVVVKCTYKADTKICLCELIFGKHWTVSWQCRVWVHQEQASLSWHRDDGNLRSENWENRQPRRTSSAPSHLLVGSDVGEPSKKKREETVLSIGSISLSIALRLHQFTNSHYWWMAMLMANNTNPTKLTWLNDSSWGQCGSLSSSKGF